MTLRQNNTTWTHTHTVLSTHSILKMYCVWNKMLDKSTQYKSTRISCFLFDLIRLWHNKWTQRRKNNIYYLDWNSMVQVHTLHNNTCTGRFFRNNHFTIFFLKKKFKISIIINGERKKDLKQDEVRLFSIAYHSEHYFILNLSIRSIE